MPSLLDLMKSGEPLTLIVTSSDPLAEIFVIDGTLKEVARDTGELHTKLPAGVYKIRQQLGARLSERTIFLREDAQQEAFGPLDVGSAVPESPSMERASMRSADGTVRERHDAARWKELCTSARASTIITSGSGSELTILCHLDDGQQYAGGRKDPDEDELPYTFDLLDASGDSVSNGPVEITPEQLDRGCYALTVVVDPGIHYMTLYAPGRSSLVRLATQQSIVASPGWQTRIYGFLLPPEDPDLHALQMDGERISINMARISEAPPFERMRLIETAKRAFVDGQNVDFADRKRMLVEKFDDPMLGLLAAHIILRQARAGQPRYATGQYALPEVLVTVLDNLENMLSERGSDVPMHPDVATLLVHLGRSDAELTISHPPMLLASWRLLIEESLRHEERDLIQIDSDVERISTHVVSSRPWMRWEAPRATAKVWQMVSKIRRSIGGLFWDGRLEVLPEDLYDAAQDMRDSVVFDAIADEVLTKSVETGEDLAKNIAGTTKEKLKGALAGISDRFDQDRELQVRLGERLNLPRNKVRHMLDTFQAKVRKD